MKYLGAWEAILKLKSNKFYLRLSTKLNTL